MSVAIIMSFQELLALTAKKLGGKFSNPEAKGFPLGHLCKLFFYHALFSCTIFWIDHSFSFNNTLFLTHFLKSIFVLFIHPVQQNSVCVLQLSDHIFILVDFSDGIQPRMSLLISLNMFTGINCKHFADFFNMYTFYVNNHICFTFKIILTPVTFQILANKFNFCTGGLYSEGGV